MVIPTEAFALFDPYKTIASNLKDISPYVKESIMNIYGIIVDVDLSKYGGLTAKQVARAVLLDNGFREKDIEPRLDRYMEDLPYSYYNVAWSDGVRIAQGSRELLEELESRNVLVGIVTGEAERVSKMRLEKTKLSGYFKTGAYGEDGMTFGEILNKALGRIEGEGFQKEDGAVIVSDPVSVSIAKTTGIRIIGVVGEGSDAKSLRAAGADLVVRSLSEKEKILDFVVTSSHP